MFHSAALYYDRLDQTKMKVILSKISLMIMLGKKM